MCSVPLKTEVQLGVQAVHGLRSHGSKVSEVTLLNRPGLPEAPQLEKVELSRRSLRIDIYLKFGNVAVGCCWSTRRPCLAMGNDWFDCIEDRLYR